MVIFKIISHNSIIIRRINQHIFNAYLYSSKFIVWSILNCKIVIFNLIIINAPNLGFNFFVCFLVNFKLCELFQKIRHLFVILNALMFFEAIRKLFILRRNENLVVNLMTNNLQWLNKISFGLMADFNWFPIFVAKIIQK